MKQNTDSDQPFISLSIKSVYLPLPNCGLLSAPWAGLHPLQSSCGVASTLISICVCVSAFPSLSLSLSQAACLRTRHLAALGGGF